MPQEVGKQLSVERLRSRGLEERGSWVGNM
jgi:hypothetical protein